MQSVVVDRVSKDHRIRDKQDAPAVLISADPSANLEHSRIKESNIDYIASHLLKLDAITGRIHVTGKDRQPACDAKQRLSQSDRNSRSKQPEEGSLLFKGVRPQDHNRQPRRKNNNRAEEFAPAITLAMVLVALVNVGFRKKGSSTAATIAISDPITAMGSGSQCGIGL